VRTVFQDRKGDLWIGTNTGGLDRLDLATRAFRHYQRDEAHAESLSHNDVHAIAEGRSVSAATASSPHPLTVGAAPGKPRGASTVDSP